MPRTPRSVSRKSAPKTDIPLAAPGETLLPLRRQGDLAARMVDGIGRFLDDELRESVARRSRHWRRDLSSHRAYVRSVSANRKRFARIIGAVDARVPAEMQRTETMDRPALIATTDSYKSGRSVRIYAVRWPVLPGVEGEGLLLEPETPAVANIVALPDCDWTPEMLTGLAPGVTEHSQFARRLAEAGCRVVVPMLIDRACTFSGNPRIRMTNQPHREFIYRAAYEMGRHIIGYEVQKVLAVVDWFASGARRRTPIGVAGYGEGGLIAFHAAALDTRIAAALVSGYFQPREEVWREPIYRNVWALLDEFGDAEIATLIAPRPLVIEACRHPQIDGPPPPADGRSGAAPGAITTPSLAAVKQEAVRAGRLVAGLDPAWPLTITNRQRDGAPGGTETLRAFLDGLSCSATLLPVEQTTAPQLLRPLADSEARLKRQFDQLVEHTQQVMRDGEFRRRELWAKADASSVSRWRQSCRRYRRQLWEEVIGDLPTPDKAPQARLRQVYDEPFYRGYEVTIDLYGEAVFAYGVLLVPKNIRQGERRPVVVCQHGLEGRPQDCANPAEEHPAYHQFACRLAERGFVTYAPQNPYIGFDRFRVLQRKANPLRQSLFSFIIRQHEQTVAWLAGRPFVDPQRIAFYGLSYGGKTAMRVPAVVEGYCLSICSGDFNEWIWKNVSVRHTTSYMFTGEYEMPEFNLGNTFNYAEMSWLICPRPFMVERGHHDGCAPDEWIGYEFAKTFRRYNLLGIGERAEIEYFDGPHAIHGQGTFRFLHKWLDWPEPRC